VRGAALVIPIKATLGAKQRLAARLGTDERRLLALAMAGDVLRTGVAVAGSRRVIVVAGDAEVAALCTRLGVSMLWERGAGQSFAVRMGAAFAGERGFTAVATLAADCPLAAMEDVEALLLEATRRGRFLACASDAEGVGTNAAALRPLGLDPWRFGTDSLRRHRLAARALGLPFRLLDLPSLRIDLDRPADLAGILQQPRPTATFHVLRQLGLARPTAAAGP
jgi:2-phospho-L-lactate guanylyltransferase